MPSTPKIFPPALARIVLKALSRNPSDRQPSVHEFIRELDAALQPLREPEAPRGGFAAAASSPAGPDASLFPIGRLSPGRRRGPRRCGPRKRLRLPVKQELKHRLRRKGARRRVRGRLRRRSSSFGIPAHRGAGRRRPRSRRSGRSWSAGNAAVAGISATLSRDFAAETRTAGTGTLGRRPLASRAYDPRGGRRPDSERRRRMAAHAALAGPDTHQLRAPGRHGDA